MPPFFVTLAWNFVRTSFTRLPADANAPTLPFNPSQIGMYQYQADVEQAHAPPLTAKLQRLTLAMLALVGALGLPPTNSYAWNPFEPPEMEAARVAPRDVVGDLGGVAVTIPRHFANYVEYEGDPGWGEKRKDPIPPRTYQSKLISFGYYTRFPDMAGESTPELRKNKASYPASQTPWIDVGINTGRNYPGEGFLDRSAQHIGKSGEILKHEQYAPLTKKQYGLTVYVAMGIDPKTGKPYREDRDAHDLFVHRDKAGQVDAYIRCSNRNVPAPPCKQDFSLEPNMRAWVYVSYRRSQLANWREIQQAVTRQILGFKAVPTEIKPAKP